MRKVLVEEVAEVWVVVDAPDVLNPPVEAEAWPNRLGVRPVAAGVWG